MATPKKPAPGQQARRQPVKNKPADKPNAIEKLVQDVTNRYRVTAREARDIVTAAGTVAQAVNIDKGIGQNFYTSDAVKNLKRQVKETGTAAVKGKKGSESDQIVKPTKTRSAMFTGYDRDAVKANPKTFSVTKRVSEYKKYK